MSLIPTLGRQRQVGVCEFKTLMDYKTTSRPDKATQCDPGGRAGREGKRDRRREGGRLIQPGDYISGLEPIWLGICILTSRGQSNIGH